MKKIVLLVFVLIISSLMVYVHGEEDFAEAERIIDEKIQCEQLTNEQLEIIGDYYIEQMHHGEAHETMDEMMGGEGSESLKQIHINMARSFYCGESGAMSSGMMNMMMGRGMMGSSGMMNSNYGNMMGDGYANKGYGGMMGMMGSSFGGGSWWLFSVVGMLFWIALLIALILLIIWLYKKIIGKTTNEGSALEVLKMRFAKGEITKKEFESMKKEIGR